jgi:hypothetical protein
MRFTVFLSCLTALALLTISGCGSSPDPAVNSSPSDHPNGHRPIRSATTYVEFMGDDQIMGLVNFAQFRKQNAMWRCSTCAPGQPSQQLLADAPDGSEISRVIALKPDVVVILTGAYDLIDFPMDSHAEPTAQNVADVCAQLTKAELPALVLYLPESTVYDPYYTNYGLYFENQSGAIPNTISYPVSPTDPQVPYTDGVDFSQSGLQRLYPAVYDRIQQIHKGGQK